VIPTKEPAMKYVYFTPALVGVVVPYLFFLQHFDHAGFGLHAFGAGLFANGAAGGFAADVLISFCVFRAYLLLCAAPVPVAVPAGTASAIGAAHRSAVN
jgi:hypothetical protein